MSIKTKVRAFVIRLLSEDDAEFLYPSIILSHFAIATDYVCLITFFIGGKGRDQPEACNQGELNLSWISKY